MAKNILNAHDQNKIGCNLFSLACQRHHLKLLLFIYDELTSTDICKGKNIENIGFSDMCDYNFQNLQDCISKNLNLNLNSNESGSCNDKKSKKQPWELQFYCWLKREEDERRKIIGDNCCNQV